MPIVIPAGFRQITLVHDVPGAHGEVDVVFGCEVSGTETEDLTEWMEAWQNYVIEQTMCPSVTFVAGRALTGPRPGSLQLELLANPLLPTQGAQGPDMLPINNAALVSVTTALGGVRGRGRKYIPGIPEGAVDNEGNLTVGGQAQYQTAFDTFLANLLAATVPQTPVLLHGTGISATPVPTPVTGFVVQRKMATQRTRLRG